MRTRVRTAERLARAAGVPDRRARRSRRSRGSRSQGLDRAAPTPEVREALAAAEAIVDRPLQPGDLDRPDPLGPGHARGDRRAPARRWSPSARYVAGRAVKGPTEQFMRAVGPALDRGRRRLALRGPDRRRWWSTPRTPIRAAGGVRRAHLPDPDGGARGPARAGRASAGVRARRSAELNGDASHGDHPGEALRRRQAAAARRPLDGHRAGRRWSEAMLADVLGAATPRRADRAGDRGHRRAAAERLALRHARRAATPLEVLRDPEDRATRRRRRWGSSGRKALGAERVALLPGDCPLLDPAELDARARAHARATGVAIVPDRHGTGTNALLLSPPDAFGPAFGPDSCARHATGRGAPGHELALERLDSLALDLDTPEDLAALRDRAAARPAAGPGDGRRARRARRPAQRAAPAR